MTIGIDDDYGNLLPSLLPRDDSGGESGGLRNRSSRGDETAGGAADQRACGLDGPGETLENPEERKTSKGARRIEEKRKAWDGTQQRSATTGRREVITYGRRLARFLSAYRCYNPRRLDRDRGGSDEDGPSIDNGWSFFEHKTLPRHLINPDDGDEEVQDENSSADAQEKEGKAKKKKWNVGTEVDASSERTALYNFWNTTEADLMDFGVGVALHFKQLRYMMLLMMCAGLISLPNMIYYASTAYSKLGQSEARNVSFGLLGSAVCTDQVWVACPTCPTQTEDSLFGRNRDDPNKIATTTGNDGSQLVLRMKNNCEVGLQEGMIALGCYIFLLIGTFTFQIIADKWEKRADKTVQAADDYTVWVRNPPQDAEDPEEWRSFFTQFVSDIPGDHVVACTVVRKNRDLLLKLMQRKAILRKMELLDDPNARSEPANPPETAAGSSTVAWLRHVVNSIVFDRIVSLTKDVAALESQVETLNGEISEIGKATFPVADVFITFETEHSMLAAMKALCLPYSIARKQDKAKALDTGKKRCFQGKRLTSENYLFRGNHVLYVDRPPPPSSICWEDLGVKWAWRYLMQAASLFLVACYVVAAVFLILWANANGAFAASCMTSFLNLVVPMMIMTTCRTLEYHESEGNRDISIFTQVSLFRWTNTVVLSLLVIPLTNTLDPSESSMPYKVHSLFVSQLLFGPAIYLLDPMGQFEHHILAPRARTQRQINLCFQGSYWTLAERRTLASTIFFLSCFYSIVYPAGFFFGVLILMLLYFCDKFLLLRTWAPAPRLGGSFFANAQQAFLVILIILYGIAQFFIFGGFPLDGLCKTDDVVSPEYVGDYTAKTLGGTSVPVAIDQDSMNYQLCFPYNLDREAADSWTSWMTEGQKVACLHLYGWTIGSLYPLIANAALNTLKMSQLRESHSGNLFKCSDKPEDIKFSEERGMIGYVPQIKRAVGFLVPFTHPFLTVDISNIDSGLLGWAFEGPESGYNLSKDFPELRNCFDIVCQWNESGQVWGPSCVSR